MLELLVQVLRVLLVLPLPQLVETPLTPVLVSLKLLWLLSKPVV